MEDHKPCLASSTTLERHRTGNAKRPVNVGPGDCYYRSNKQPDTYDHHDLPMESPYKRSNFLADTVHSKSESLLKTSHVKVLVIRPTARQYFLCKPLDIPFQRCHAGHNDNQRANRQ